MKLRSKILAGLTLLAGVAGPVMAQETRTLTLIEDYDQKYMCTKVFELKNVKAEDLTPFVVGAVKRYKSESDVQRLNYSVGKKSFLVVSTGVDMMPYVEDMITKLDRPCSQKDANGSIVDGDGIYRFVYYPKFRATANMREVLKLTVSEGANYVDLGTNMFYWKDSLSDGNTQLTWLKALDREIPQLELQMNVYELNENDFIELGVDYISWKNGPGADLLGVGYNFLNFKSVTNYSSWENMVGNVSKGPASSATGVAGFMVAPQFDATFLRMLYQKGRAKVASSGSITVRNDATSDPGDDSYSKADYRIKFVPSLQNITKDSDRNISVSTINDEFYLYFRKPTIGFNDAATEAATIMFGWVLNIKNQVEETNTGTPVYNTNVMRSWLTLDAGTEKLLGSYVKEHKVNQNNGMPFLNDIPGFKYLVGATEDSKTRTIVFVTVKATPVKVGTAVSEWAGKMITAAEMVKEEVNKMDK